MLKKRAIKAEAFQADQLGIDQLKNEFFDESQDFVYFRKGEWTGFESSLEHVATWVQQNPEWMLTVMAPYYILVRQLIKDIVKITGATTDLVKAYFDRRRNREFVRTVRVILSEAKLGQSLIAEWEDICGQGGVTTIPEDHVGYFRYLVNERRYAIFSRLGPNDLRGFIGKDRQTIGILRYLFDREFVEASIRNQQKNRGN